MARTLNEQVASKEQVGQVVATLVELTTKQGVDPNVRVKAAGLVLNHVFDYHEEAPDGTQPE